MATHGRGQPPKRKRVYMVEDDDGLDLIFPYGITSSQGSSTGDTIILKEAEVHAHSSPKEAVGMPHVSLLREQRDTRVYPVLEDH